MKEIVKYTLLGIALSACMVLGWWIGYRNCQATTECITDTITDLAYDTVYFSHFDTVHLPAVVINDTLIQVDSVYVQIPISTYQYDTIISDTNYTTSLKATVSGFGVSFDSLYLNTKIMQQEPKNTPKWYENICPSAGVGFGTGGFGFFVGIGYKIF